jgi:hypothetical protein
MAARKKQGIRKTGSAPAKPADAPRAVPERGIVPPSSLQKCLLAAAILLEASWIAALVAMALAE